MIDALARGRTLEQIRLQGFAEKRLEGSRLAAVELGMLKASGRLTDLGTRFALADAQARSELLRGALMGYGPYAAVLSAAKAGEVGDETEADWIARLWSTAGFGSSESNRAEGVATFGRLAEAAGLAEYIPGRRGHPTRLRWTRLPEAPREPPPATRSHAADAEASVSADRAGAPSKPPPEVGRIRAAEPSRPQAAEARPAWSEVVFVLGPGRVARLELPPALTRAEKDRLLRLVDVLVRDDDTP
jgi:hypothetical protein